MVQRPWGRKEHGKKGRKMVAEGSRGQGPGSGLYPRIRHGTRKEMSQRQTERPPGNYVFISKVILRQLVIDSPPPPPLQSRALSAMWLQSPMSIWDTGRCMVSGKVCLDFYGLVKRCAGAIKSGNKKCSEIYIYVL